MKTKFLKISLVSGMILVAALISAPYANAQDSSAQSSPTQDQSDNMKMDSGVSNDPLGLNSIDNNYSGLGGGYGLGNAYGLGGNYGMSNIGGCPSCIKRVPVTVPEYVPRVNRVYQPIPVRIPTVTVPVYNRMRVEVPVTQTIPVPYPVCDSGCNSCSGGTDINGGLNMPGIF